MADKPVDAYQEHVQRLHQRIAEQPEIIAQPRLNPTEANLLSDLIERVKDSLGPATRTVLVTAQTKIENALADAIADSKL